MATDARTPRILRIAGNSVSARGIAQAMSDASGEPYRTLGAGSIGMLGLMIAITRLVAPQPDAAFPPWQGMQYMRDQFSGRGKLDRLDNDRYSGLSWISVPALLGKLAHACGGVKATKLS